MMMQSTDECVLRLSLSACVDGIPTFNQISGFGDGRLGWIAVELV